jgi:hypothetical protein
MSARFFTAAIYGEAYILWWHVSNMTSSCSLQNKVICRLSNVAYMMSAFCPFHDQRDMYVPPTKSLFQSAGITVSHFFSMLPSTLKYLHSVEPARMNFPTKQPYCTNDTHCALVALNNKLYKMHVFLREAVRPDLSGNVHTMYNYCGASYWPRAVSFYFQCKFLKFKV